MALSDFPRHPLTFGPSPVHPLPRLSARLGGASVWAKREDCNAGLAYGGNKTRKLEYIVPDVLARGADTLVSIGGYQSNHTRQVAAVAASLGLKAVLVQENWVDWPDSVADRVGWAGDKYGIPVESTLDAIRLTGRLEGVIIDPVYEGKSMAGLIDLVTSGEIPADSTVLYAHLGGQPALNAYSGLFT